MITLLPAVAPATEGERFSFTADRMETVLAEGRERTLLTGNVTLVADDFEITAQRVELYGEELNFALSEGGVRVVQPEHGIELVSESLLFDRQERVVRIQGEALLIDHDNEMVIKGGFLEHWERRNETLIQIGVRILSEDLVARAQFVRYDRGDQTVTLSGLPVVTWQGDEYRATRIFIDLDDDRIVLGRERERSARNRGRGRTGGHPRKLPAAAAPPERGDHRGRRRAAGTQRRHRRRSPPPCRQAKARRPPPATAP